MIYEFKSITKVINSDYLCEIYIQGHYVILCRLMNDKTEET